MNLSTTWTSRELSRVMDCSKTRLLPSSTDSSRNSLHSVQKTSGLFDTDQASNATVASKASKPAVLDADNMDMNVAGFVLDEDLGGIISDMPFDLMEADYLDSFVDLSNFLLTEESMKGSNPAVSSVVDNGVVKETVPMDFSGIISHLNPEPTVAEVTPEVETSATPSLQKRSRVEYGEMDLDEFVVNVVDLDISGEIVVSDHDYVTKKRKMASPVTRVKSSHVTSTSQSRAAPYKSTDKYRERRDKNNEASRRSRQIRKQKYVGMDQEANELEVKNESLRKKIVELEALAKTMKAMLIKKMTEK